MNAGTGLSSTIQISAAFRAEDVCPNDSHLSANAAAAQPQEFEGLDSCTDVSGLPTRQRSLLDSSTNLRGDFNETLSYHFDCAKLADWLLRASIYQLRTKTRLEPTAQSGSGP